MTILTDSDLVTRELSVESTTDRTSVARRSGHKEGEFIYIWINCIIRYISVSSDGRLIQNLFILKVERS